LEKDAFWDFICQEEKSAAGFKPTKDRYARFLGGNSEGIIN
jgi:hypothetical protein